MPHISSEPSASSSLRRMMAYGVHLFTASGAAWGFLALWAAAEGRWRDMFLWLALALFVDGIDGSMARKLDVERNAPRFSGASLDLVVDYLTYVIVPVYALIAGRFLPGGWDLAMAALIMVTSAMYFADEEMKTEDAWFQGFPAVWNLVIFYVFLLTPPPPLLIGAIITLSMLTFAPIMFVHPIRVRAMRSVTTVLLLVWSGLALWATFEHMAPPSWAVWALCLIGIYFLVLGYFRVKPPGAKR